MPNDGNHNEQPNLNVSGQAPPDLWFGGTPGYIGDFRHGSENGATVRWLRRCSRRAIASLEANEARDPKLHLLAADELDTVVQIQRIRPSAFRSNHTATWARLVMLCQNPDAQPSWVLKEAQEAVNALPVEHKSKPSKRRRARAHIRPRNDLAPVLAAQSFGEADSLEALALIRKGLALTEFGHPAWFLLLDLLRRIATLRNEFEVADSIGAFLAQIHRRKECRYSHFMSPELWAALKYEFHDRPDKEK